MRFYKVAKPVMQFEYTRRNGVFRSAARVPVDADIEMMLKPRSVQNGAGWLALLRREA
jgi:hypothetical protein